ncbi:MAG TPA: vanadium-dependent haloperoxidase [Gemmatimonadaceae bacterium]
MRFTTRLIPLAIGIATTAAAQTAPQTSSVRWNRLLHQFVNEASANRRASRAKANAAGDSATLRRLAATPLPMPYTSYTLVSVAQYAAIDAARNRGGVSTEAAIASASATVLNELIGDSAARASIARELASDIQRAGTDERAALAGEQLGRDIARAVLKNSPTLNLMGPWNGTIPKGPGMWYSARGIPPIGAGLGQSRAWLLDSAAQFRPAPPPAFGSPSWNAALEEVQRIAKTRTAEQTRIARNWDSSDPWARWNEFASNALTRHQMSDAESARILALLNVAASDAIIACFEAKYHYWSIRPSQADTTLMLADSVGLPNFPSYPSGHACSAGAFDAVLGHFFPSEKAEITRIAEEQAMSRLYGGIHYRFDNDAGLNLGRAVARFEIDRERSGELKSLTASKQ